MGRRWRGVLFAEAAAMPAAVRGLRMRRLLCEALAELLAKSAL